MPLNRTLHINHPTPDLPLSREELTYLTLEVVDQVRLGKEKSYIIQGTNMVLSCRNNVTGNIEVFELSMQSQTVYEEVD